MTSIVEDVQSQGISSDIITLYDLEYAEGSFAYFFPDGLDSDLTAIKFRDSSGVERTYTALPAQADDFDISSDGAMARPKFTVANLSNTFSDAIGGLGYEDLIGKRLTRRTTLKKYLVGESGDSGAGNAPVEFPKTVYVIDRLSAKDVTKVEFELAAPFDLAGIQLPRRVVVGGSCPWKYTGASPKKFTGSAFVTQPEREKVGGCNWRADGKITIGGTEYTLFMTPEDEYILPFASSSFTDADSLSSFSAGTYYKTTEANLLQITSAGILSSTTGTNYWRCISNTSNSPSDADTASWSRVWIYSDYSATAEYKGYKDKRYNEYVLKSGFLWKVNRTTQLAATTGDPNVSRHYTVEEGLHWTRGDVCGKTLTSCAMRFQAVADGNGGYTSTRASQISLPYGGYPGVVQRR
jgi:lambda family phage minor tail protein L